VGSKVQIPDAGWADVGNPTEIGFPIRKEDVSVITMYNVLLTREAWKAVTRVR